MSRRANLLSPWLRLVERPTLSRLANAPVERLRRRFALQAKLYFRPPRGTRITETTLAGLRALEIGPESRTRLLYLHGGAYGIGSPETHCGLVGRMTARTGLRAVVPDYPLAPEHPFPAAPEAVFQLYREISKDGPVILLGDSAGGGLALALLGMICAAGLAQPVASLVLSPWTDLTLSGESIETNGPRDVVLPRNQIAVARDGYLGPADPTDPRASPLFADFSGAGPVHVWVGSTEILRDDSRRIVERLVSQGVDAYLTEEHDLPHVWPLFPGWLLPEAEETLDQMAEVVAALA